jgi:alpha-tubulin suppressor-like RCC1 family protein
LGIGNPGFTTDRRTPTLVLDLTMPIDVAAGGHHTCAINDADVFCWGANDRGQLGNLTTAEADHPLPVADLP